MDLPQTSGIDSLKVYEVPNIAEIDVTLTAYNRFPYDVVRTTSYGRRRYDVDTTSIITAFPAKMPTTVT